MRVKRGGFAAERREVKGERRTMGKRCGPWLLYFFWGKFEGDGVDAVALAGGGAGGVVEDVTEVGIAVCTGDFGTDHAV